MLLTGVFVDPKTVFGFFETQPELAAMAVKLADIKKGHRCLEPSAGTGNLVVEMLKYEPAEVEVYEIQEKNRSLMANRNGIKGRRVVYHDLPPNDFLQSLPPSRSGGGLGASVDRVVMNPPFVRQQDIDHVTHAITWVKSGGKLVAIMAAGVEFRNNQKTRDFRVLLERAGTHRFHKNPDDAFVVSDTGVKTVTLVLEVKR